MSSLLTVNVNKIQFFAYHGLFEEEQKTGNEFEVTLAVSYDPGTELIDKLAETVNYASLFALLQEEMQKPRELLETFVMEVANRIHNNWPGIKRIELSLSKLNPPIATFTGSVGVKYLKEY